MRAVGKETVVFISGVILHCTLGIFVKAYMDGRWAVGFIGRKINVSKLGKCIAIFYEPSCPQVFLLSLSTIAWSIATPLDGLHGKVVLGPRRTTPPEFCPLQYNTKYTTLSPKGLFGENVKNTIRFTIK